MLYHRYLHPRQHAIEFLFLSTGFASATLCYLSKVLDPSSMTWGLLSNFKPVGPATTVEKILFASLLGSFSLTLAHKIIRKNKLFMLQPCHMSAGLLLLTMSNRNKSSVVTNLLFNIYLHTQWGAIAALLFPDLRDQYLIGETFNFFAGTQVGLYEKQSETEILIAYIFYHYRTYPYFGCSNLYDL
jgi:hypothetical protein